MTITTIQEVRLNVGDFDPTFPFLDDETITFFLTRNNNSIRRASLDAARAILMLLATRGDTTVDIFSIRGAKSAEQYRLALELYIKDPNLNPVFTSASIFAGGVSKSDTQDNKNNSDNNVLEVPYDYSEDSSVISDPDNPFEA